MNEKSALELAFFKLVEIHGYNAVMSDLESSAIRYFLEKHDNNRAQASREMKIQRTTLVEKIRRMNRRELASSEVTGHNV